MKHFILPALLAVLFVSDYAMAQPSCPCDTAELPSGTTGNDIVAALCPDGRVLPDVLVIESAELIQVFSETQAYAAGFIPEASCGILQTGSEPIIIPLNEQELLDCRARLIQGCGLTINPIPTLSEWGMIAMAGVLGMIGLFVAARRRKAAA